MNRNTPTPRNFSAPHLETIRYTAALMDNKDVNRDRIFAKADAAQLIKLLREQAELSQTQFALRLGVTTKVLVDAESGTADYQHTVDLSDRARSIFGTPDARKEF